MRARRLWRAHHDISPPHIPASGRRRCCVAGDAAHGAGGSLSVTAGAHRRRLCRRRGHRHPGAADGSMAVGPPRPAIHRREPRRRQRQYRDRDGRQGARGWLHAAADRDPACDQRRALQQSQFRLHPRHRAGDLRREAGLCRRGESVGPRHDDPRVHRLCQGQPGQDQLRIGRPRHAAKHCLRTLQDDGRRGSGPRPLSRRRACDHRSARPAICR